METRLTRAGRIIPGLLVLALAAGCTSANPYLPSGDGGKADQGKKADGPGTDGVKPRDTGKPGDGKAPPDQAPPPDQKIKCKVPSDCADGLFCTTDNCVNNTCTHTTQPGYCAIGSLCVYTNTTNPNNKCQNCDTSKSTTAWSPHPGGACDDQVPCTHSDTCSNGVCKGIPYTCDDKLACTSDTCTGKAGGCTFSVTPGQCLISGTCLANGAADPQDPCQVCDSSRAQKSWSQKLPVTAACPWAAGGGGAMNDSAQAVAVDAAGNSYLVGFFYSTATFGTVKLTAQGDRDIFVVKVDPLGKVLWAASAGGAGLDIGLDIAVDATGNSRITGYFKGSASFGSHTVSAAGGSDLFVAGLSSAGAFTWALAAGGSGDDYGKAIALDSSGNSLVLATYSNTLSVAGKSYTANGTADNLVLKVSSSGAAAWAASSGGIGGESATGIAVDSAGAAYYTGGYFTSATFGAHSISNNNTAANDIYLAKIDASGSHKWAISAGGAGSDYTGGVAMDGAGNGYFSGHCVGAAAVGGVSLSSGGFFLARFDAGTGKVSWLNPGWSALATLQADSLATDSAGNVYGAGFFTGSQTLGSTTLTSAGARDAAAFRVSPAGAFSWAAAAGGANYDYATGVAATGAGSLRVAGTFEGAAAFGSPSVALKSSSSNDVDVYVWKP